MTLRMAEGLPEGLVTSTAAIKVDIESVDRVAAEDIMQLWRVYSANRNLLSNDVGRRLENLFWRIWSNGKIMGEIRGSQIANIFETISEGRIIRTTPTSSPRSSRLLPTLRRSDTLSSSEDEGKGSAGSVASQDEKGGETDVLDKGKGIEPHSPPSIEEEQGRRRRGSSRPPPILKKPGMDSSAYGAKTARILTPTWKTDGRDLAGNGGETSPVASSSKSSLPKSSLPKSSLPKSSLRNQPLMLSAPLIRSTAHFGSEPSSLSATPPLPSLRDPSPEPQRRNSSASSKPKKKAGFTANSKKRPVVMRRKSSQSSSSTTPKAASPRTPALLGPPDRPSPSNPTLPVTQLVGKLSASPLSRAPITQSASVPKPRSKPPSPTTTTTGKISSRPTSRSASPISSVPFHRPSRDHLPDRNSIPPTAIQQDWLVDRDFRTKFVDKVQKNNPFANIMSKSTSVATAASSFQAGGLMAFGKTYDASRSIDKGKGKMIAGQDEDEDEEENVEHLTLARLPSQVMEEDEGEEERQLPRTKSQLTMLLKRDRKSGGKDKRNGKASANGKGKR